VSSYWQLIRRIWVAPGNRGRRVQVLLRSVLWLVNKKTWRRPWTLPVFGDLRLRCYPDSIIALHVVQRSEWHDWDTAKFITSYLRDGDALVDVGANIGLYTLPAAKVAHVIAVEPSPVNRARLEENLALNGITQVRVEGCALGDAAGEMAFSDEDALAHVKLDGVGLKVPVRTYDDIAPIGEVALMKVDVEGFELAVFRGAQRAMRAGLLPVIVFEMNNSFLRYGGTAAEILEFLRAAGYQIGRWVHDERRVAFDHLEGDLVAFTARGEKLIQQRFSS
jgi:FkbM family methyltransferase